MAGSKIPLPKEYREVTFPGRQLFFIVKKTVTSHVVPLSQILGPLLEKGEAGRNLTPVTAGRGTLYFINVRGIGEIAIRPYRHGGLSGKLLGTRFSSQRRFLNELILTEAAREAGITYLEPIGIAYLQVTGGVRGIWLSRRMWNAESLHAYMAAHPPTPILVDRVARIVAKMHRSGISHADLTIQNILIEPQGPSPRISIIDFDKAVQNATLDPGTCARQLRRLDRSLLKWLPKEAPWSAPTVRLRFAAAYCRHMPELRPLVQEYIQGFRRYERRYRLGWALQKLLREPTKHP